MNTVLQQRRREFEYYFHTPPSERINRDPAWPNELASWNPTAYVYRLHLLYNQPGTEPMWLAFLELTAALHRQAPEDEVQALLGTLCKVAPFFNEEWWMGRAQAYSQVVLPLFLKGHEDPGPEHYPHV